MNIFDSMEADKKKFRIKNLELLQKALGADSNENIPDLVVKNVEVFGELFSKEKLVTTEKSDTIYRALKDGYFTKTIFNSFLCCLFDGTYSEDTKFPIKHNFNDFKNFYKAVEVPTQLLAKSEIKKYNSVIRRLVEKSTHLSQINFEMSANWNIYSLETKKQILKKKYKWSTLILFILIILFGYFFNNYKNNKQIEKQILNADKLYNSKQYAQALREYKSISKKIIENDSEKHYSDLLNKIGKSLLKAKRYDEKKITESIMYFIEARSKLKQHSDSYNYNCLELSGAYEIMYIITNRKEYLDEIKKNLDKIKSDNLIIEGLKQYTQAVHFNYIKDFENAIIYLDAVLKIFKDNKDVYHQTLNHKANNLIELFHESNNFELLDKAKLYYNENYDNSSDKIVQTMAQFGIGHVLRHEYKEHDDTGKLFEAELNLQSTLNTYNIEDTPSFCSSSNIMLAEIKKDLYLATKNKMYLTQAVECVNNALEFYSLINQPINYHEALYLLVQYNYLLEKDKPSLLNLKKVVNICDQALQYFTIENDPKIFAELIAIKSECYRHIGILQKSDYFLKKSNDIIFHFQNTNLDYLSDKEIYNIGYKYSKIHRAIYSFNHDEGNLLWAVMYEGLLDENKAERDSTIMTISGLSEVRRKLNSIKK